MQLNVVTTDDPRGLEEAAAGMEILARKVDDVGDQMRQTGQEADRLDRKIAEQTVLVKELGHAYVETSDKMVLADLKRERSELNALQRIKREIAAVHDVGDEAE